jgi:hypothetical protein
MATSPLTKITARAKQIRKAKPSIAWGEAIQKASAEYRQGKISGATKKKTVVKAKKPRIGSPSSKPVRYNLKGENVSVVKYGNKSGKQTIVKTTVSRVDKGAKIMGQIEKLEKVRAGKKHKHEKDFYAVEINGLHKQLRGLHKK